MFLFVVGRWSLVVVVVAVVVVVVAARCLSALTRCLLQGPADVYFCHVLFRNCLNPTESILLRKMQQTAKRNIILVYLGHSARCLLRSCPASWWLGPGLRATAIGSVGLSQKFEKLNCMFHHVSSYGSDENDNFWSTRIYPRFRQTLMFVRLFLNTNERMSQSGWLCHKMFGIESKSAVWIACTCPKSSKIHDFTSTICSHIFCALVHQCLLQQFWQIPSNPGSCPRCQGVCKSVQQNLGSTTNLETALGAVIDRLGMCCLWGLFPSLPLWIVSSEWSATVQKQNLILPRFASLIMALCCVYTP